MYSQRSRLEAGKFRPKKKREIDCTAVTAQLICVCVFTQAKIRFFCNATHMYLPLTCVSSASVQELVIHKSITMFFGVCMFFRQKNLEKFISSQCTLLLQSILKSKQDL